MRWAMGKSYASKNILYFLEWMQLNRNFKVKEIPTFHTSTAYMMQFDDIMFYIVQRFKLRSSILHNIDENKDSGTFQVKKFYKVSNRPLPVSLYLSI